MAIDKLKTTSLEDNSITSDKIASGAVTISDIGDNEISMAKLSQVDLTIAPEVLEIQVDAPDAGQATVWKWTWEQSTLPYARRTITNSNELNVPLYKEGTYVVNNFAAYDIHGSMSQTHSLYLKWIDGAGTDNLISWATSAGPISDTHPDINGGNATDVQRITVNVPGTITLPTLTNPSVSYTVVNNASGGYTFSGSASGDNPNLGPFYRGGTYTVNINATGHPFYFTTDNGTNFSAGTYFGEYTSGVTGSRTDSGTITFTVPANAPDTLYYQCGNHSVMRGAITVKDLAVETNINGNYVVYFQHTQEGHKTPVELRPIPSLVNQMCLVYDNNTNKFVPQDLATYVENTPSFENKIREVAGTAELVVEDGSAVIAKVNVYDDSTYLPLTGNNPGDQAFATDTDILYIWDGSAWQQAGAANSDDLTEGSTNLFFTNARADARVSSYLSSNDFDTATNIVASITDSAPGTLDTLNELAAALGDDPNFATTVTNSIATKLPLSGGAMTGAITTNSTFDGRDVATDGTKLDGIEASADVTDTANVTAAGALMDSEVNNLAQVKAFDSSDYATATQGTTADSALPKAGGTMTGNVTFGDNNKAIFGAGSDLQIYSDSANSIIHETDGTGNLIVKASNISLQNSGGTATLAQFIDGGKSSLRYNNVEKLATTATGIDVTGNIIFGDNHAIVSDGNDNLVIESSSSEDVIIKAGSGVIEFRDAGESGSPLRAKIDTDGNAVFYKDLILNPVSSPTTSTEGAMYYDSDDNTVKFYDGSNWIPMGGNVNRYNYTATANQTSFAATYTATMVDVYLNGTKLTRTTDYTDTSGTTVVLTTGADVGDLINIVAFSAHSAGDAVSIAGGTFTGTVDFDQNINVTNTVNASNVRVTNTGDLTLAGSGHGFQIGPTAGQNIAMDNNEIMSRNNGVGAELHLNPDGGDVTINNQGALSSGSKLVVRNRIELGDATNATTKPTAMLHIHKDFSTSAPVTLAEAPSIVLSENETTGAGNQGYHGAYWFGSQDTNTPSDFNWYVAGMASQSSGGDTGPAASSGNLEFYTTPLNTGTPTKSMELSINGNLSVSSGSFSAPSQPAFEAVKYTDTIGTASAMNYLRAFDSMTFQTGNTGSTGMSLSTGQYTAPADGLYHFSCTMTWDGGDAGDDSFGIGFIISNNSTYYNYNYADNNGFRMNPRWETTPGQEMMVTISKTCRLAAGAKIGLWMRDVDHATINLQHAEFSGFKFA